MRVGIAADHAGFGLKTNLMRLLENSGHQMVDFGNSHLEPGDDYPSYVVPLAKAIARGEVDRGIAICGSGVGAAIAANKIPGVRASLVHEAFSAHQGVEDDDMNMICLGGHVIADQLAYELAMIFLHARFNNAERHCRRLGEITKLEAGGNPQ